MIKPGMLCIVTGYRPDRPAMAANVGREVTVVRWLETDEICSELQAIVLEPGWLVAADGLLIQYAEGDVATQNFSGADPQHLMPLHPPAEEPSRCARQSKLIPA